MQLSSLFKVLLVLPSLARCAQTVLKQDDEGKVVTIKLKRSVHQEVGRRHLRAALLQFSSLARAHSRPVPSDLYGVLKVGVPAQEFTVAFDTGSGNILIPSKTCTSSACVAHRAYDGKVSATSKPLAFLDNSNASLPADGTRDVVKINIGRGIATGFFTTDRVCVGANEDLCAPTALVECTDMSIEPFNLVTFDGILGIGLPDSSLDKKFNFLGNLAEKKALRTDQFAVWLSKERDGKDSEMTLGGFDQNRLGSEVLWAPVQNLQGRSGYWEVKVRDIAVNGMKMGTCDQAKGCRGALDTGTSVIAGPSEVINSALQLLNVEEDCANYDSLPKLGFAIGHYVLNIDASDYVKRTDDSCVHQLQALDIPPPRGPVILLGDPFLRRYYTIYDRDSLQVGIGLAVHNAEGGGPEDMAKVAERLMVREA